MNAFQNPLIRIIASIAVGLLLILYPNAALPTILLIIGILIGLPSLYALLVYLLSEDRNKLPFPVLSLVMLLFGCTLMLFPGWYIAVSYTHLEEMLPDSRFIRVHRSFIVQGCKIKMIDRNRIVFGKEYIPISDTYKDSFAEFISRHTPLSNK